MNNEMIVSYLNKANWKDWLEEERDAVEAVFRSLLDLALCLPADRRVSPDAVELTTLMLFARIDLRTVLHIWEANEASDTLAHLARLIREVLQRTYHCGSVETSFRTLWGDEGIDPVVLIGLVDWLTSAEMHRHFEAACFAASSPATAERWSETEWDIRQLRSMRQSANG